MLQAKSYLTPGIAFARQDVPPSIDVLLATKRLTKRFAGLQAIDHLDLEIQRGTVHSLIGPNGAGKTTVFNCIMQNIEPSGGEIVFAGQSLCGLTPDRVAAAGISRTYQNIRLFRSMTALDNLLVGMHLHTRSSWWGAVINSKRTRHDEASAVKEALNLLRYVGLRGRGDMPAGQLSYGEQRRLEIGRALATRPALLMLDEPTAGMNPTETTEMMTFISAIKKDFGATILLIEHQMRVVMGMSDRVTVLDRGAKIAEGMPVEIQRDARVIEAYLGRSPGADGRSADGSTRSSGTIG